MINKLFAIILATISGSFFGYLYGVEKFKTKVDKLFSAVIEEHLRSMRKRRYSKDEEEKFVADLEKNTGIKFVKTDKKA
jgi:hypothetical protein